MRLKEAPQSQPRQQSRPSSRTVTMLSAAFALSLMGCATSVSRVSRPGMSISVTSTARGRKAEACSEDPATLERLRRDVCEDRPVKRHTNNEGQECVTCE
ncbi:hypothetical protein ACFL3T_03450 [Patescibacteria group bacterium]